MAGDGVSTVQVSVAADLLSSSCPMPVADVLADSAGWTVPGPLFASLSLDGGSADTGPARCGRPARAQKNAAEGSRYVTSSRRPCADATMNLCGARARRCGYSCGYLTSLTTPEQA